MPAGEGSNREYAQMLWKETRAVGCAFGSTAMVCAYDPSGLKRGSYVKNVPPPMFEAGECVKGK